MKRCEQCRIVFGEQDKMLVKTTGVREITDKEGKRRKITGNVYLHFLTKCLKSYVSNFNFGMIVAPKQTQERLPKDGAEKLKNCGVKLQ